MSAAPPLDTAALDAPPSPSDVERYRAALEARCAPLPGLFEELVKPLGWTAFGLGLAFVAGIIAAGVLDVPSVLVVVPCWALLALGAQRAVRRRTSRLRPWTTWARCDAFAIANGMRFTPFAEWSDQPGAPRAEQGMLFRTGQERSTRNHFERPAGSRPRFAAGLLSVHPRRDDVFDDDGGDTDARCWTYVVLGLGEGWEGVPQVLLHAVGGDRRFLGLRIDDFPVPPASDERLPLTGEAGRLLQASAPAGTHQRARELLTPQLLDVLVDPLGRGPGTVHTEVTGGEVLLCWDGELFLDSSSTWRTLETTERRLRAVLDAGPLVDGGPGAAAPTTAGATADVVGDAAAASAAGSAAGSGSQARLRGRVLPRWARVGVLVVGLLLVLFVLPHLPGG